MPRFVLLFHECPSVSTRPSHWDFMLEFGGALRTWALPANPLEQAMHETVAAQHLPDHRLAYLDYEGPISDGRGSVARIDAGQFQLLSETELELVLELAGDKLGGQWNLSRTSPDADDHWLLRRI